MSTDSKTQSILKDKSIKTNLAEGPNDAPCLPCAAKKRNIWKISIPREYFLNPDTSVVNYKNVGEILVQYAKFSEAQVQSLFVSISLIDTDEHLVYTGDEQTAVGIFNELGKMGIHAKIEVGLKKF